MGNEQSIRKVSFEREPTGLIAVSDSVAKRLQNAGSTKTNVDQSAAVQKHIAPSSGSGTKPTSDETHKSHFSESSAKAPEATYQSRFVPSSGISEDEHAQALRHVEEKWQERYKRILDDMEKIGQQSANEFSKAVKDVEDLLATESHQVVNSDLQKAVMECYRENTTRSLKCSKQADAFIKSVEDYRIAFLEKQALL